MNRTDRMRLHISLDEQIADLYTHIFTRLQSSSLQLSLSFTEHPVQQLSSLKQIFQSLFAQKQECADCMVYEKELQKLEADIRQHIKVLFLLTQLEHQLKLYQDSLEQKATETKKQRTGVEKEIQGYKKRLEELKEIKSIHTEQISKLQTQNQQLKNQIKLLNLKKSKREDELQGSQRGQSIERREIAKRLEARTMMIDRAPLTKTINFNSTEERRSIDKAKGITITEDMSKHRQSLNNKSSHLLKSGVERKKLEIVMRDKENEKRRINKIEYRR